MSDQNDLIKQHFAGVFSRAAAAYDHTGPSFFAHFGRNLVDAASPAPGMRVLDLACGRGAVALRAAELVGPQGEVAAVDLAEGMVSELASEAASRGLMQLRATVMDAENLRFPDAHFDRVCCGMAMFFFPDFHRVLAEIYRVLKPGGIFAFSTWGRFDPRWAWVENIERKYVPMLQKLPRRAEWFPYTKVGIRRLMHASGFPRVSLRDDALEVVYHDPDEWWQGEWSHGARSFIERLPADQVDRYRADMVAGIAAHCTEADGIHMLRKAHYTIGRKPRAV